MYMFGWIVLEIRIKYSFYKKLKYLIIYSIVYLIKKKKKEKKKIYEFYWEYVRWYKFVKKLFNII